MIDFQHEIKDNIIHITLSGDLIGENKGPGIINVLNDYLENGNKQALVDIEEVRYMNSSGIGVLITVLTKLRNKGGDMALLNPSEQVEKLLVITKLKNIFNVFNEQSEAISFLRSK